jgi:hypothetical protein
MSAMSDEAEFPGLARFPDALGGANGRQMELVRRILQPLALRN